MRRFEDRVALVTGAASGIGRATALRLAREGARVVCADMNERGLEDTIALIENEREWAIARRCDVSDPAAAAATVSEAIAAYGSLDVLCNIAGVGAFRHTAAVTAEEWSRVIAVNLSGTFFMSQAALPHLLAHRGAVVNMASSAGLIGQAYCAAYCASKGGVIALTRALAVEFSRQGLRVNCICPGGVDTGFAAGFAPPPGADIDLIRRLSLVPEKVSPADVAGAVAYLASDEARHINGAALSIDDGMVVA